MNNATLFLALMKRSLFICLFFLNIFYGFGQSSPGAGAQREASPAAFSIGDESFLLNGRPFVIRCGEMHFARIPREYWTHRLKMAKAMGLNTVCAYLFWNVHEPQPGAVQLVGSGGCSGVLPSGPKGGALCDPAAGALLLRRVGIWRIPVVAA